jgi:predicted nuclease of predicted toxin-antitoxin system
VKLLLDSCLSGALKAPLAAAGHDVQWVGEWPTDPGDEEILSRAHAQGRVLVTLDKDFGELAIVQGRAHSGLLRLTGLRLASHADAILNVLRQHADVLATGGVVTVEPGRVRVRVAR